MTEIPGTASPIKNDNTPSKVYLENLVRVQNSRQKNQSLNHTNKSLIKWVCFSSFMVGILVVFLCVMSDIKFALLLPSGPGLGVMGYKLKELLSRHFKENDILIKRY